MFKVNEDQKRKLPQVLDLGTIKILLGPSVDSVEQREQEGQMDPNQQNQQKDSGGGRIQPNQSQGKGQGKPSDDDDKQQDKNQEKGTKEKPDQDRKGDGEETDGEVGDQEDKEGGEGGDQRDQNKKDQHKEGDGSGPGKGGNKKKEPKDPDLDNPDENIFVEIDTGGEDDKEPPPPPPPPPPGPPEPPQGEPPQGPQPPQGPPQGPQPPQPPRGPQPPTKQKPKDKDKDDKEKKKDDEEEKNKDDKDPEKYGGEVKPPLKQPPDEPPGIGDLADTIADLNQVISGSLSGQDVDPEKLGKGGTGIAISEESRAYSLGFLTDASASRVEDDGAIPDPGVVAALRPILEAFLKISARKLDPSEMDPQDVARRGKPTLIARGVLTKQKKFDLDKLILSVDLSGSVNASLASKLIKSYFYALQVAMRRAGKSAGKSIQMISMPYADDVAIISAVASLANIPKVALKSTFDQAVVEVVGRGTTAPIPMLSNLDKLISFAPAGVNKRAFLNKMVYIPFLMFTDFLWYEGLGKVLPALKRHMQNKIFLGVSVGTEVKKVGTIREILKYVPYSAILDPENPRQVLVSHDVYTLLRDSGVDLGGVRYIPVSKQDVDEEK